MACPWTWRTCTSWGRTRSLADHSAHVVRHARRSRPCDGGHERPSSAVNAVGDGGEINLCRPPDTFYPEVTTYFTARHIEPTRQCVGSGSQPAPPPSATSWVDRDEWPTGVPLPEDVYAVALSAGPIHHVNVKLNKGSDRPPWEAYVQFFDTDCAERLDAMYPEEAPFPISRLDGDGHRFARRLSMSSSSIRQSNHGPAHGTVSTKSQ